MTQEQVAGTIRAPLTTLRIWEKGRVQPGRAARALLTVIKRESAAALRTLR
jgi:DNA-binding transcriptional regulator YiaG